MKGTIMSDFHQTIKKAKTLTEAEQKKASKPIEGDIEEEHRHFLETLIGLIKSEEIDPYAPKTFIKKEIYDSLDEEWHEKADLALINIANQVRRIHDFRSIKENPDESPQLQTMVEELWQMKQRIEVKHDVFKF